MTTPTRNEAAAAATATTSTKNTPTPIRVKELREIMVERKHPTPHPTASVPAPEWADDTEPRTVTPGNGAVFDGRFVEIPGVPAHVVPARVGLTQLTEISAAGAVTRGPVRVTVDADLDLDPDGVRQIVDAFIDAQHEADELNRVATMRRHPAGTRVRQGIVAVPAASNEQIKRLVADVAAGFFPEDVLRTVAEEAAAEVAEEVRGHGLLIDVYGEVSGPDGTDPDEARYIVLTALANADVADKLMSFAVDLRELRETYGLDVEDVADAAGLTVDQLADIENGDVTATPALHGQVCRAMAQLHHARRGGEGK